MIRRVRPEGAAQSTFLVAQQRDARRLVNTRDGVQFAHVVIAEDGVHRGETHKFPELLDKSARAGEPHGVGDEIAGEHDEIRPERRSSPHQLGQQLLMLVEI